MSGPGIDYGMGTSNRDPETGIRYGVISQGSIAPEALSDMEPDYGEATCPECGNTLTAFSEELHGEWQQHESGCADYVCESCEHVLDNQYCFDDAPNGFSYDSDGYKLQDCLDSDIFVLASPFYTFAEFCSPCVPGAGNLDSDNPDGVKTFCLGHDWFEDGKAPYPVYRVDNDEQVQP